MDENIRFAIVNKEDGETQRENSQVILYLKLPKSVEEVRVSFYPVSRGLTLHVFTLFFPFLHCVCVIVQIHLNLTGNSRRMVQHLIQFKSNFWKWIRFVRVVF